MPTQVVLYGQPVGTDERRRGALAVGSGRKQHQVVSTAASQRKTRTNNSHHVCRPDETPPTDDPSQAVLYIRCWYIYIGAHVQAFYTDGQSAAPGLGITGLNFATCVSYCTTWRMEIFMSVYSVTSLPEDTQQTNTFWS